MRLHPLSVVLRAGQALLALGAVLVFSGGPAALAGPLGPLVAVAVAGLALAGVTGWQLLVWRAYEYEVDASGLDIRSGVIARRHREIPLHRVQNVDVRRPVVARLVGLAEVRVETAGGGETEARLRYVTVDEAERLQRQVRRLRREGEPDDDGVGTAPEVLFEVQPGELLLMALTHPDPRGLAAVGVAGGLASPLVTPLLADPAGAPGPAVAVALALVLGLVLLAWAASAVSTWVRFHGFRLERADDALLHERGLLDRVSGTVPRGKIQSLVVEENLLKRLAGVATLEVETAGYAGPQAQEQGAEVAVPLARLDRVLELARDLEPFGALRMEAVPTRARRRYGIRYGLVLLALAGALAAAGHASPLAPPWWTVLGLAPLVPLAAHLKWANLGVAEGRDHVGTRRGFWVRRTRVTRYGKLQVLLASRTVFQRRWDLASVTFDTAGSRGTAASAVALDVGTARARELRTGAFERMRDAVLGTSGPGDGSGGGDQSKSPR